MNARRASGSRVCPTRVGMNRASSSLASAPAGLPHTRGDEPAMLRDEQPGPRVCPTRVGMNRMRWMRSRWLLKGCC